MPVYNQSRSRIIKLLFGIAFLVIFGQLFYLQVLSGRFRTMADENAILRKVIYPSRGVVFDRRGKAILNNVLAHDLMVTPGDLKQRVDTNYLCSILSIDTAEFSKRIRNIKAKNNYNLARPGAFESLLTPEKYARLQENMWRFSNAFFLQERPIRTYPFDAGANILGYMSEVDTGFLRRHAGEGYEQGDYAGKSGLERSYEKVLMGQRGIQMLIRDKNGKVQGSYENGAYDSIPVAGSNMHTSVDIELQQLGEQLMKDKLGAVVAIDPRTGGILAMASGPSYNPNDLTGPNGKKSLQALLLDPRGPMNNRGIGTYYSPGSTFKSLQGLIGLQEGVIRPSSGYPCGGRYNGCGTGKPKCHGAGHSGNLKDAIAVSCNSYFADVFRKIIDQKKYGTIDSGLNVWARYMSGFGLGHRLGVDLPSEKNGLIPTSQYYNKAKYFGPGNWNSCSIVSVSIGQGEVLATMTQMANAIAMIANKGWYYTPHIVDSIQGGDRLGVLDKFREKHQPLNIPDSMFETVHSGMQAVMDYGTGSRLRVKDVVVCGKTGTVENYYRGKKQKDHSFFAAFAPRQNPKIAIVCIVENGGFGATIAGPVVSLMIEKYLHDTLSKERKPWVERYSGTKITPAYIADEYRRLDSIRHAKDTSYLIRQGYLRRAIDSLELEEDAEEIKDKAKTAEEKKGKEKKDSMPGKAAAEAVLPADNKRNEKKDSLNNK